MITISDYNKTHKLINFCGIKIKFPKWEFLKLKKAHPFYYYKKNNLDITTIPPAEGLQRDLQLANLALLKELDFVCKQNNLKYWIDFGSLLGAVRHKGFIPWDDDVDTGMLREDYDKLIEIFSKSSRDPDIVAEFAKCSNKNCHQIIKIRHKKCPSLFVDIFPYDYYGQALEVEEQIKVSEKIKKLKNEMQKKYSTNIEQDKIQEVINIYRKKILKNTEQNNKSDLVWGLDYPHSWKKWLFSNDIIFPLKEIEFEGIKFPCINKPEEYLKDVYGNYLAYPKKLGMGHSMFLKPTEEEQEIISKLKEQN